MILIDYNAVAIGNLVVQRLNVDENLIRHMILNSIRMYRQKFQNEYGEVVIVADGQSNWRRDVFPQYKYKRKEELKCFCPIITSQSGGNSPFLCSIADT